MRAECNYRLNCGQYVLHLGDDPAGPVMDEVALCIDTSPDGCGLMKHGAPEMVQAYAKESQVKLRARAPDWAEAIVVATESRRSAPSIAGWPRERPKGKAAQLGWR